MTGMMAVLSALGLLSFFGYFHYLTQRQRMSIFMAPVFIITCITGIMHFAGILNILQLTWLALLCGGLYCLWIQRRELTLRMFRGYGLPLLMLLLLLGYLLYYIWDGLYPNGDSMTHWGIVARSIVYEDRFPNFMNKDVLYQSYPLAVAVWCYTVLRFIGYSEAHVMFAKGLWILACAASLYTLNRSRSKWGYALITLLAFYVMRSPHDLRVDILLGLVTGSGLLMISEQRHSAKGILYTLIPFLIVIPLIKNSGLLFVLFLMLAAAYALRRGESRKTAFRYTVLFGLVALLSFYLWYAHSKLVYEDANMTRHALSMGSIQMVTRYRTWADVQVIWTGFVRKWFDYNQSLEWIVLPLFLVIMALAWKKHDKHKAILHLALCLLCCYALHKLSLFLMYALNMHEVDIRINGYERYQETFSIIVLYVSLWAGFEFGVFEKKDNPRCIPAVSYSAVLLSMLLILSQVSWANIQRPNYQDDTVHRTLYRMIQSPDTPLAAGQKVIVHHSDYFTNIYTRFTFENPDIDKHWNIDAVREALETNKENYQYLIILEHDEEIKALLKAFSYPEDAQIIPLKVQEDAQEK